MNIIALIKELQAIADKDPTLTVWCPDGGDPSEICPVQHATVTQTWGRLDPTQRIVELRS